VRAEAALAAEAGYPTDLANRRIARMCTQALPMPSVLSLIFPIEVRSELASHFNPDVLCSQWGNLARMQEAGVTTSGKDSRFAEAVARSVKKLCRSRTSYERQVRFKRQERRKAVRRAILDACSSAAHLRVFYCMTHRLVSCLTCSRAAHVRQRVSKRELHAGHSSTSQIRVHIDGKHRNSDICPRHVVLLITPRKSGPFCAFVVALAWSIFRTPRFDATASFDSSLVSNLNFEPHLCCLA
jgi:hypothetical protein